MKRHLPIALIALAAGVLVAADPLPRPKDGPAPSITVSEPFTHANLTIFLLRGKDTVPVGHQLLTLQEAMEQKKVVVHETSQVNELSIENVSADVEVFVQSGDIVRGGKQDRLMAFDMIVPPKSGKIPIASFCCESGRWRQRGGESDKQFAESKAQAANKDVKLALNASRSQPAVWDEVKKAQDKLSGKVGKSVNAKESPSSYQLTLEDKDLLAKVDAYVKALTKTIDGKDDAIGFAIVINGKVQGADVYGSAALFRKLWPKLLNAAAVDALAEFEKDKKFPALAAADVEKFMAAARDGQRKDVALTSAATGRHGRAMNALDGQAQAANPAPNSGGRGQSLNPPTDTPALPALAQRLRIVQTDTGKAVMVECQDSKNGHAVVHQSYIAK
jgi:hypothetical protein